MNVTGNKAKVFWTGGWDSTFEMCRLSLKPIQIEPVYLIMDKPYHVGQEYEIRAQDKILDMLKKRDTTKAEILPLTRVHIKHIFIPKFIKEMYERINFTFDSLGSQYYYFGAYAFKHPGMMVMISDYYHSVARTMRYIRKCNCRFDDEGTMYIVKKGSDPDWYNIFGRCLFPLASINQDDITKWIEEHQFWDVMKNTWTCYYPIDGKPCGFCHACNTKLKQHLDFLIPEEARKRGFVFNYLCSQYEFSKERIDLLFCMWLRNKYNPEMANLTPKFGNLVLRENEFKRYHNEKYKNYFSEKRKRRLKELEPYFESLLKSDIEYRNVRDRVQKAGLV